MSYRVGVLVVHGMGSQKPGFSENLRKGIGRHLDELRDQVCWQEAHWADVLEPRQDLLWQRMAGARSPEGDSLDLDWRKAREFVVHSFGDALAYHRDYCADNAYRQIHHAISSNLGKLYAALDNPAAPIVVMAHSLGCHIMSDYIWDRQKRRNGDDLTPLDQLLAFVTFGCNIPLFSMAMDCAYPMTLPGPGIPPGPLREHSRWLNFFDADDVLGWPMKPLYDNCQDDFSDVQKATVRRIEDRTIGVGGLLDGWTPISHGGYWEDRDLARPVARYLRETLEILVSS